MFYTACCLEVFGLSASPVPTRSHPRATPHHPRTSDRLPSAALNQSTPAFGFRKGQQRKFGTRSLMGGACMRHPIPSRKALRPRKADFRKPENRNPFPSALKSIKTPTLQKFKYNKALEKLCSLRQKLRVVLKDK